MTRSIQKHWRTSTIWEHIAQENIDAADRVIDDIFAALRALVASPHI